LGLLLIGRLSDAEAAPLQLHLSACRACRDAVRAMRAEDTLVEAGKAATPAPGPVDRRLIERIDDLRQGGARSRQEARSEEAPSPRAEDRHDFLAPPQAPDELGRLGSYRVLEVIGSGGMGIVYRAEDEQLKRLVALKTLRPVLAADPVARQRFLREARATAAVEHDHVVGVYQVGEDRGVPYIAMQFLEGETLDERLRREVRLPAAEAARIGGETCEGLAAIHRAGLVHRDVKPSNILLERESGRVKILDFGLARAAEGDDRLTQTGAVTGTLNYLAPEQARGTVDARCDLFSLGCVLYQAVTGRKPFDGADALAVLASLALDTPPAAAEIEPTTPPELSGLIGELLAKDPTQRPGPAEEVVRRLGEIECGPVVASPTRGAPTAPVMPVETVPTTQLRRARPSCLALDAPPMPPQAMCWRRSRPGTAEKERVGEPDDGVIGAHGE